VIDPIRQPTDKLPDLGARSQQTRRRPNQSGESRRYKDTTWSTSNAIAPFLEFMSNIVCPTLPFLQNLQAFLISMSWNG
jgi:hypothetical protein